MTKSVNFKVLTIETFDENFNGVLKAKLRFRDTQIIKSSIDSDLGDQLRKFIISKINSGAVSFPKERPILYGCVKDSFCGEVSCLVTQDSF